MKYVKAKNMESENTSNKWYDNKWLVYLLSFAFFPVGLYGLWKTDRINKLVKIIVSALVVMLFIIGSVIKEEEKIPQSANKEKLKEKEVEEVVKNEGMDNRVIQVYNFLKHGNYLKDPDSYEPISWWAVYKNKHEFIEYRETTEPFKEGAIECIKGEALGVVSKEGNQFKCVRLAFRDSSYFNIDSSLTVLAPTQPNNSYTYSVVHEYRSKNSFGGFVVQKSKFFLNDKGEVVNIEQ